MNRALTRRVVVRLAPVALVCLAAAASFFVIQDGGPWVAGNLLPLAALTGLSWLALYTGDGYWARTVRMDPAPTGRLRRSDWRMPLGVLGFAIPALGLSVYLHYAYSVNLDGMFDNGPGELFRYLPIYTGGAGGIGFAIGWIVGRNLL